MAEKGDYLFRTCTSLLIPPSRPMYCAYAHCLQYSSTPLRLFKALQDPSESRFSLPATISRRQRPSKTTIPCPSTHVRAPIFPSVDDLNTTTTLNNDPCLLHSHRRRLPSKTTALHSHRRRPPSATDDLLPPSLLVCKADIPPSRCSQFAISLSLRCLDPAPHSPSSHVQTRSISSWDLSLTRSEIRCRREGARREYGDKLNGPRRVSVCGQRLRARLCGGRRA